MDFVIFLCLIAGVACLIVSFLKKEKTGLEQGTKEKIAEELRKKVLEGDNFAKLTSQLTDTFKKKLDNIIEDSISKSTDDMSKVANDKMLAINDMSVQILEKIEQNHKEVIFLYDMLNEKNERLKDLSSKIDGLKRELSNKEKSVKDLSDDIDKKVLKLKSARQLFSDVGGTASKQLIDKGSVSVQQSILEEHLANERSLENNADKKKPEKRRELTVNEKILQMKKSGKSVLEISKTLNMGQGEVELILGLYK